MKPSCRYFPNLLTLTLTQPLPDEALLLYLASTCIPLLDTVLYVRGRGVAPAADDVLLLPYVLYVEPYPPALDLKHYKGRLTIGQKLKSRQHTKNQIMCANVMH